MITGPEIQNLQQLIDKTTGGESVLGIVLEHPNHGRLVLIDIDRRNNSVSVYFESQNVGFNGFRTIMFNFEEYKIFGEPSFKKQMEIVKQFLL